MKIEQIHLKQLKDKTTEISGSLNKANLVIIFGGKKQIKNINLQAIKKVYPYAHIFGCSTAGEIFGTQIFDDTITVTAIHFEHTKLELRKININDVVNSYKTGEQLALSLPKDKLAHVFVLSDGTKINGSDLVCGLRNNLPQNVKVTGGLAGDGVNFEETYVLCDDMVEAGSSVALGLYGNRIKVGYGSCGGWDTFGPERLITRSKDNVLYELDGKSALALYKMYLGEEAKGLPATGLVFPLCLRKDGADGLVRTVLAINEKEQSMTFAGNVPEGSYARLMKANFDRIVDGAVDAATKSYVTISKVKPELAILISCVGRKMILQQRTEEEVEGVKSIFGDKTMITGFYSYGEISPLTPNTKCELHNQTMTITTLSEC